MPEARIPPDKVGRVFLLDEAVVEAMSRRPTEDWNARVLRAYRDRLRLL